VDQRQPFLQATADASTLLFLLEQVLTTEPKGDRSSEGGDSTSSAFFESLFIFADKDDKGELVVEDLETLFQAGDETSCDNWCFGCNNPHLMSRYRAQDSLSCSLPIGLLWHQ